MKIYTRTGDSGSTSLVGGKRVGKDSARLEAYGTIDELNSHIGLLRATPGLPPEADPLLDYVQNKLFNIGAYLATDNADNPALAPAGLTLEAAQRLEAAIDQAEEQLPPLREFILPGGTLAAAQANVARTVCRRAERRVTALANPRCGNAVVDPAVTTFINRLSDYLFNLGRLCNHIAGHPAPAWRQTL